MSEKTVLDTHQVCQLLRKTPMSIHRYRKDKGMPFFHVETSLKPADGKKPPVRFYMEEVIAWANGQNLPWFPLESYE